MLQLFVDNPELSDAVVPIRWCISPATLEVLKTKGDIDPHILISISHGGYEVDRRLYRLKEAMAYIQLHRSGVHTIHAIIVWSGELGAKAMRDTVLSRPRNRSFEYNLYTESGRFEVKHLEGLVRGLLPESLTEIEVNVGAEFFAPEPATWRRWWVNLWFETSPRDQCQFRRRHFVAFSIQPILVGIYVIVLGAIRALYAAVSLLLGMRNVHFAPILHPFRDSAREVCPHVYNSDDYFHDRNNIFLTDKNGKARSSKLLLVHPVAMVVYAGIAYLITRVVTQDIPLRWALWGLLVVVVIALALFFVVTISNRWDAYKKSDEVKERRRAKDEAIKLLARRQKEAELECVTCNNEGPLVAKVSALPKTRRTITLRFGELKAKVCRPYSR